MRQLQYPFHIRPLSVEDGGGYMIEFPDLAGCIADGETPEEAIANGMEACEHWLDACRELGRPIPEVTIKPIDNQYSGKLLLRFPKTMHARLAARAKQEGVSLNQLTLSLVAEGLGRQPVSQETPHPQK